MFIKIPFQINNGTVEIEKDIILSINSFIELIISSTLGSFKPENDFGFIFQNYRFENFDENSGTIMNKKWDKVNGREIVSTRLDANYTKKISDTSRNSNSFAFELKRTIEKYEQRLKNIYVDMKYDSAQEVVTLLITGRLNNVKENDYKHTISFQVW